MRWLCSYDAFLMMQPQESPANACAKANQQRRSRDISHQDTRRQTPGHHQDTTRHRGRQGRQDGHQATRPPTHQDIMRPGHQDTQDARTPEHPDTRTTSMPAHQDTRAPEHGMACACRTGASVALLFHAKLHFCGGWPDHHSHDILRVDSIRRSTMLWDGSVS